MNILIFGGRGKIGSRLTYRLEAGGHSVNLASRISGGTPKSLEYVTGGEVNLSGNENFDLIVNASGKYAISPSFDQLLAMNSSILEVANTIAATNTGVCAPILNLSSYFQFLPKVSEAVSDYTRYKQAASDILHEHAQNLGVGLYDIVLLDNFGFTGHKRFLEILIESFKTERPLSCSVKRTPINLIHADDLLDGLVTAAENLFLNPRLPDRIICSLSSPVDLTLGELDDLVCQISGIKSPLIWGVNPPRIECESILQYMPTRLENWNPRISLRDYISNSFENPF